MMVSGLTMDSTVVISAPASFAPTATTVPVYYCSACLGFNAHYGWSNVSSPQPSAVLWRPEWHSRPLYIGPDQILTEIATGGAIILPTATNYVTSETSVRPTPPPPSTSILTTMVTSVLSAASIQSAPSAQPSPTAVLPPPSNTISAPASSILVTNAVDAVAIVTISVMSALPTYVVPINHYLSF